MYKQILESWKDIKPPVVRFIIACMISSIMIMSSTIVYLYRVANTDKDMQVRDLIQKHREDKADWMSERANLVTARERADSERIATYREWRNWEMVSDKRADTVITILKSIP